MDKIIKLRKTNIIGVHCEITDKLNSFNRANKKYASIYLHPLDGRYVIRGYGATRGCVDLDENGIISSIRLLEDCYSDMIGVFKPCDREAIEEAMKEFIGYKIED